MDLYEILYQFQNNLLILHEDFLLYDPDIQLDSCFNDPKLSSRVGLYLYLFFLTILWFLNIISLVCFLPNVDTQFFKDSFVKIE